MWRATSYPSLVEYGARPLTAPPARCNRRLHVSNSLPRPALGLAESGHQEQRRAGSIFKRQPLLDEADELVPFPWRLTFRIILNSAVSVFQTGEAVEWMQLPIFTFSNSSRQHVFKTNLLKRKKRGVTHLQKYSHPVLRSVLFALIIFDVCRTWWESTSGKLNQLVFVWRATHLYT